MSSDWTQERRARLEAARLHEPGCPLSHAPVMLSSCCCGMDIFAAMAEIDRLRGLCEPAKKAIDMFPGELLDEDDAPDCSTPEMVDKFRAADAKSAKSFMVRKMRSR